MSQLRTNAAATYDAVLVTPIALGSYKLGMIAADQQLHAVFPPDAVDFTRALASLVAVALWQFQAGALAARSAADAAVPDVASLRGLTATTVETLVADARSAHDSVFSPPVTDQSAGVALAKARTASDSLRDLVRRL